MLNFFIGRKKRKELEEQRRKNEEIARNLEIKRIKEELRVKKQKEAEKKLEYFFNKNLGKEPFVQKFTEQYGDFGEAIEKCSAESYSVLVDYKRKLSKDFSRAITILDQVINYEANKLLAFNEIKKIHGTISNCKHAATSKTYISSILRLKFPDTPKELYDKIIYQDYVPEKRYETYEKKYNRVKEEMNSMIDVLDEILHILEVEINLEDNSRLRKLSSILERFDSN